MVLITNVQPETMIEDTASVVQRPTSGFIEANTKQVGLEHLKNECIIPVFAKDNESTISHYEFINETYQTVKQLFPDNEVSLPEIRVSHQIKGRIPSAVGKPAKELLDHEKTIYYERCAFLIEVMDISETVNRNQLTLSIGGVRSLSQENLYAKKSLEKFKVFIGFQNKVCTNLCVSTDGFTNKIRAASCLDLEKHIVELAKNYNHDRHLGNLEKLSKYSLSQEQFAHFIGKARMYNYLTKQEQQDIVPIGLNDSQINNVVRDYYRCQHFNRNVDGSIDLWRLYNLFTEANKSSYIDSNIERNILSHTLVNHLANSLENDLYTWHLN
jgi:hypothetical protein